MPAADDDADTLYYAGRILVPGEGVGESPFQALRMTGFVGELFRQGFLVQGVCFVAASWLELVNANKNLKKVNTRSVRRVVFACAFAMPVVMAYFFFIGPFAGIAAVFAFFLFGQYHQCTTASLPSHPFPSTTTP